MLYWIKRFFNTRSIATVRVVYKSGYTHDFKVYKFKYTGDGYQWEAVNGTKNAIVIGADEIAAVWQLDLKKSFWSLSFS